MLVDELTGDPSRRCSDRAPLSVAAARTPDSRRSSERPEPEFTAACLAASGGNPLLLWELLEGLAAEGVAPVSDEIPRVREIGPGRCRVR